MAFCIRQSEYDPKLHDMVHGPFAGPCDVCDSLASNSLLIRFNGGTPSLTAMGMDEQGRPVLSEDVSFYVLNETSDGAPAPTLVNSIEYVGPNVFLVVFDPSYTGTRSFQIKLTDSNWHANSLNLVFF